MKSVSKSALALLLAAALSFLLVISFFSAVFHADAKNGNSYYISSSEGDDKNDGMSESSPWESFENIKTLVLKPGDKVLLKRGDVWNERLDIHGGGDENNHAYVGAYGDEKDRKPSISLSNGKDDICVLIGDLYAGGKPMVISSSYLTVENLDLRNSRVGIFVRASLLDDNRGLIIRNCEISNIIHEPDMELCNGYGKTFEENLKITNEMGANPQGNLPKMNNSLTQVSETGGGAGEYSLPTAIMFSGFSPKIFTDVLLENIVLDQCIVGIEAIRTHDITVRNVVCTGSWAGITRFSANCSNIDVSNVRLLSGCEDYTFFGGTCGGFLGMIDNAVVRNSEFAYEYNLGQPDGCGFDFEYTINNVQFINNVLHHNASGGMLIMDLAEGAAPHSNVAVKNNLFYSNMTDPSTAVYNYDILMYNKGNQNLEISENFFYKRPSTRWGQTVFYGNPSPSRQNDIYVNTIIRDNTEENLEGYRTRFSFNRNGNLEGFEQLGGSAVSENGALILTSEGKNASVRLRFPINGFAYQKAMFRVAGETEGKVYFTYTDPEGNEVTTPKVTVNGEGYYAISLSENAIAGYITDFTLHFEAKRPGASLRIDTLEFMADIAAQSRKLGDNTLEITFVGKADAILSSKLSPEMIEIEGLGITDIKKSTTTHSK